MDYSHLTTVMRRLALEAGARIMEIHQRADLDTQAKEDGSPVTEADRAADTLISEGLAAEFPGALIVTEEQAASHTETAEDFLIVDPLDGTKEFIRRQGDFTVNIAWVEAGAPVRGVVYAPARGRLFYTDSAGRSVEEAGPFDPAAPGGTRPLSAAEPDNSALRVVASKSHRDAETDSYIAGYEVAEAVSAGSSLKFCLIASGEADLYPRLGRTMEWDTAAGHAVVAGAGGHVLRLDDHLPLVYGKAGYANPSFLACAPGVTLTGP